MTHTLEATTPDLARRQAAPAAGLGERRLRRRRRADRARRGAALRHRRPARRLARARRRHRQRQRRDRGRAARLHGGRRRLRARAARARTPPRRSRGPPGRAARGRRRGAAVPRRLLRRGHVRLRLHVRPRPRPGGRRAAPRLRPGGTIALASWTPDGFIGELFRTVAAHVPPPAGVQSPMLWGTEAHLRELFGEGIASLEVAERTFTFRFRSAEDFVDFFRHLVRPDLKAFAALDDDARRAGARSRRARAPVRPARHRRDRRPRDVHRGRRCPALSAGHFTTTTHTKGALR